MKNYSDSFVLVGYVRKRISRIPQIVTRVKGRLPTLNSCDVYYLLLMSYLVYLIYVALKPVSDKRVDGWPSKQEERKATKLVVLTVFILPIHIMLGLKFLVLR